MKEEAPNYLINLIPKCEQTIRTRNNRIPVCYCRTESFKHSFFPYTLKDCFSLDDSIKALRQFRHSKIDYHRLFVQFRIIYSISLTQLD